MKKFLRLVERTAHSIGVVLVILAIAWIWVRPSEKSGVQPNFAGAEQQQKRLVVFLDGTWNSVDSNTSVWRMRALSDKSWRVWPDRLAQEAQGVSRYRRLIKTPDWILERPPQGGLSICAVCCGALSLIGTSRHSLRCSDKGRFRTNNGREADLRLKSYAAFDPTVTTAVQ